MSSLSVDGIWPNINAPQVEQMAAPFPKAVSIAEESRRKSEENGS